METCDEALDKSLDCLMLHACSGMDAIRELRHVANKKLLTLAISENLKEKGADSIFTSRAALHIVPDCIAAARFINRYGLL